MNNSITRLRFWIVLAFAAAMLSISAAHAAYDPTICSKTGIVVAFINGVQTRKPEAIRAVKHLRFQYGDSSPGGEELIHDLLYNDMDPDLTDFVEVFNQRLAEHDLILKNRMEFFFEAINGGGSRWDLLKKALPATASLLEAIANDWLTKQALKAFQNVNSQLASNSDPQTATVLGTHRAQIASWIVNEQKVLLVGHSQGNLFLRVNYDYADRSFKAVHGPGWVRAVQAGPASSMLRGDYSLADKDLVINGLRLTGSVPAVSDTIPGYLARPAGVNGATDILGHGWFAIYQNPAISTGAHVTQAISKAIQSLDTTRREYRCNKPEREIRCNTLYDEACSAVTAPCRCENEMMWFGGSKPPRFQCMSGYGCLNGEWGPL